MCPTALRVDQDEGDAAGFLAAIDPGVVGALLDQHVARLHVDLAVVEQHVDLAVHDDGVVDGAGAVHERMARRQPALRRVAADLMMQMIVAHLVDLGADRRELDDAEHRAARGRRDADLAHGERGAVGGAADVGRRFAGHPQQPRGGRPVGALDGVRIVAVEQDDGLAAFVDGGDDAAHVVADGIAFLPNG